MAVTVLDSAVGVDGPTAGTLITTTTGYTPPAGTDRALIVVLGGENGAGISNMPVISATYGGQPLTSAVGVAQPSGTLRSPCEILYMLEAELALASGTDVVVQFATSPADNSVILFTLGGVDQSSPIVETASSTTNPGSFSLGTEASGATVAAAASGNPGVSASWSFPNTAAIEFDDGSSTTMVATETGNTTTNETVSVTLTGSNRATLCAASFRAAGGGAAPQIATLTGASANEAAGALALSGALAVAVGGGAESDTAAALGVGAVQQVDLDGASEQASGGAIGVTAGFVTVTLGAGAQSSAAGELGRTLGGATVELGHGQEQGSAGEVVPTAGGLVVELGHGQEQGSGQALGVTPGPLSVALGGGSADEASGELVVLAAGGVALAVAVAEEGAGAIGSERGPLAVDLEPGLSQDAGLAVSVTDAVVVPVEPAQEQDVGHDLDVVPGASMATIGGGQEEDSAGEIETSSGGVPIDGASSTETAGSLDVSFQVVVGVGSAAGSESAGTVLVVLGGSTLVDWTPYLPAEDTRDITRYNETLAQLVETSSGLRSVNFAQQGLRLRELSHRPRTQLFKITESLRADVGLTSTSWTTMAWRGTIFAIEDDFALTAQERVRVRARVFFSERSAADRGVPNDVVAEFRIQAELSAGGTLEWDLGALRDSAVAVRTGCLIGQAVLAPGLSYDAVRLQYRLVTPGELRPHYGLFYGIRISRG